MRLRFFLAPPTIFLVFAFFTQCLKGWKYKIFKTRESERAFLEMLVNAVDVILDFPTNVLVIEEFLLENYFRGFSKEHLTEDFVKIGTWCDRKVDKSICFNE